MNITITISSTTLKRLLVLATAVTGLTAGGVAYAELPKIFGKGDQLKADDLNENFKHLNERLGAVEASTTDAAPKIAALEARAIAPAFTEWQPLSNAPTLKTEGGSILPTSSLGFINTWRREGDSAHVRTCSNVDPSATGAVMGLTLDGLPGTLQIDQAKVPGSTRVGLVTIVDRAGARALETCPAVNGGNGLILLYCREYASTATSVANTELCFDAVLPVVGWTATGP
jgi:hypothetical protein